VLNYFSFYIIIFRSFTIRYISLKNNFLNIFSIGRPFLSVQMATTPLSDVRYVPQPYDEYFRAILVRDMFDVLLTENSCFTFAYLSHFSIWCGNATVTVNVNINANVNIALSIKRFCLLNTYRRLALGYFMSFNDASNHRARNPLKLSAYAVYVKIVALKIINLLNVTEAIKSHFSRLLYRGLLA